MKSKYIPINIIVISDNHIQYGNGGDTHFKVLSLKHHLEKMKKILYRCN